MQHLNGFIIIRRKMLMWEWYTDTNVKVVFLHLLLTASYKDTRWKGETVLRGQVITSLDHLAAETGLTVQKVRTALNKLESTGEITKQSTNHFTKITVCNYEKYQDFEKKEMD